LDYIFFPQEKQRQRSPWLVIILTDLWISSVDDLDLVKQCFQFQNHNFKPHHLWKDSMKILLLLLFKNYLIYATFIYVCCDSFRIYCRGTKYSFFGNIVGNLNKKNIGKISTHTPFPILIYRTWKIKSPQKKILTPSLFLKTKIYPKKYFWLNETKKKNKAQKINPWEFCAHPKKWATNKNIRVVQFLLQGFLLFWKYKRTNHKRNYLKKAY